MSTDAEIAVLAREAPHDPLARYRWRCALVRAGRGAEAGFEEGDEVSVGEHEGNNVGFVGRVDAGHHWLPNRLAVLSPDEMLACRHDDAWTLLAPAKPKGGAS